METLYQQSISRELLKVPFDKKWEILRPTIAHLYVEEGWKLTEVINCMRERHNFNASESQYKYHIGKWKLKKSLSTKTKEKLCKDLQSRAQAGKSSILVRKGKTFDKTNLRRYVKTETRKEVRKEMVLQPQAGRSSTEVNAFSGHPPLFGNRIFMNWNMPYVPSRALAARTVDYQSPLSDIMVTTPVSANSAPSPTTAVVRTMTAIDRARLFIEGRHIELLRTMDSQQRVKMSTWMYQFWLFSFKTAKHWGRGPQDWTATMLGFDSHPQRDMIPVSSPKTPVSNLGTPAAALSPMEDLIGHVQDSSAKKSPSNLCKWSIHAKEVSYEHISSPPPATTDHIDLEDEQAWPRWPPSEISRTITERLRDGLENNSFSDVRQADLPIAVDQITKAAKRSSKELEIEALGFIIMSRNEEELENLLNRMNAQFDYKGLYPFHLAASYLDGAKTCCNILNLVDFKGPRLQKRYTNDLGHTVLDHLMMGILKAHTSCPPVVVDVAFKKEQRFEGEDVDICGRWDADSDCIRSLLAEGTSSIPFKWKHMFCHTSVQTMVHSIGTLFGSQIAPNINTSSGLFVRHCSHCGLKMQNTPLHTLIITGVHLAQSGCENENLFGILACLVCLLRFGANPLLKARISLEALMVGRDADECDHIELNPLELLQNVPSNLTSAWSKEMQTGWQIISKVLNDAQVEWQLLCDDEYCSKFTYPTFSMDKDEDDSDDVSEDEDDNDDASEDEDDSDDASEDKDDSDDASEDEDDSDDASEDEDDSDDDSAGASEDDMWTAEQPNYFEHPCSAHCDEDWKQLEHTKYFGRSKILAPLWAAIQTELLTYRRVDTRDPWISPNFDMAGLNDSLNSGGDITIAWVKDEMMKPFCGCGRFLEGEIPACTLVDEATDPNLVNFGYCDRTTYIGSPEYRMEIVW